MKLFELAIGNIRRYVPAEDEKGAYAIGTDPAKHPDISFLPFTMTEVTVPGYTITLTPADDGAAVTHTPPAGGDDIPTEREALKAWLTERGVDFNPRLGDAKLLELAKSLKPPAE